MRLQRVLLLRGLLNPKEGAVVSQSDDSPLIIPISALQHYRFCPRQCALIYVEQTYDENIYTLRGNRAHENVNEPTSELVEGVRRENSLPVWSTAYGISGIADVVEFRTNEPPYPVEHKVGKRKARRADEVQLCAQGLCLEEMFDEEVNEGALYYAQSRRRRVVELNETLREMTIQTIHDVRKQLSNERIPPPVADERCPKCSLIDSCLPNPISELQVGDRLS